jgi:RIO kinase 2
MSAAEIAVKVFSQLDPEDTKILLAIELAMDRYQYVPEKTIPKLAKLSWKEVSYRLSRVEKWGLIRRWSGAYIGYMLNTAGYDCLAINALVNERAFEAFGKPLGVGKEADVYDALTSEGSRVAIKFHRLGRISFRQTRRVRGYVTEKRRISWLHQSKLAAEKEFEALKFIYPYGISVPEPINQNRHAIVMGMIEGVDLFRCKEIPNPKKVLDEILFNVRKTYLEAEVIHADLSEFNVILKPNWHVLIIDWPQFVNKDHVNAEELLQRDIENITTFFQRKFGVDTKLKDILNYVKGVKTKN